MYQKIFLSLLASLLPAMTFASDSILPDDLPKEYSSVITFSGGVAFATAGQNQYLYPSPVPAFQYYAYNSSSSTAATGEIFFGLQEALSPNWVGQLGLSLAGMTDVKVTGSTNVNGNPNAYDYSYKVSHGRLALRGKLIAECVKSMQPYVTGSLGVAFNDSHDYIPVWNNASVDAPLWYGSNVTTAFPYSVGLGVQKNINKNWQAGVGYEFADLGKSYLNGDGVVLGKGLRLTHLYTNQVLLSVSYSMA
jgi:opacity protein-like surface antigen